MLKNGTILIADDEPDMREIIAEVLENLHCEIIQCTNGQEALDTVLKKISEGKPVDAILSDINMPEKTGIEFLTAIRSKSIWTPFVFLTAYGDKENALAALRLGAFDFVEKPFQFENLIKTMSRTLELGVSMRTIEQDFQKKYQSQANSPEELIKMKEAHAKISMMKIEHAMMKKKAG